MGLSTEKIRAHIEHWSHVLKIPSNRDYRAKWPRYLFRHEPLENASQIIKSGQLLSRDQAQDVSHLDIAAPSVISTRNDAYAFTRLYFRPLNPTQYHVEGIRKQTEFYLGNDQTNAPVLVMFLFSAESVLAMPGTHFSNGNMQGIGTEYGNDTEFFDSINFQHVFHDGPRTGPDAQQILKARCAEVLTTSPLYLEQHLLGIRCRSEAERITLIHLCGDELRPNLRSKIKTYTEVGLFQNRFSYLKSVDISSDGLSFSLHPREDSKEVIVRLEIHDSRGTRVARVQNTLVNPAKTQRLSKHFDDGKYLVRIWVEDQLGYNAVLTVDSFPF